MTTKSLKKTRKQLKLSEQENRVKQTEISNLCAMLATERKIYNDLREEINSGEINREIAADRKLKTSLAIDPVTLAADSIKEIAAQRGMPYTNATTVQSAAGLQIMLENDEDGTEALLMQAATINALAASLLDDALKSNQVAERTTWLALYFKASAEHRRTLEAIANINHPRTINIAGQINNSKGHQQVNNHIDPKINHNDITRKTRQSTNSKEQNAPIELEDLTHNELRPNSPTSENSRKTSA